MKVSVIMPTYNRADMLPGAIESFLMQDYENAELIILNNGSTDNTAEIIDQYVDYRIRVINEPNNLVPPNNFNELLKYTTGDLICHLHDDDRMLPDGISKRVKAFEQDPNLQVLYAGWVTNGRIYNATPPDSERIVREEYINFLTLMWRKDVNGWMDPDLRYYHDWLFKIQCFRDYKVGYIPDPVIDYTIHLGQASIECRKLGMNGPEERLMREKIKGWTLKRYT